MCGIFGLINFDDEPASIELLQTMGDRMVHRGPDDEGHWRSSHVGLGMRRLSIIDLAGGHQPIGNETGDVQIVLNGEIYNYRALREDLLARGHRFATDSDVEVLVHLYEERGLESIHALNGMFAFALYDTKRDLLWIARDRIGIKPMFYCATPRRMVFASDLLSLNAVIDAPLSPAALTSYLGYSYVPAPDTLFEGVRKLMPGEEIVIDRGRMDVRRYWQIDRVTTSPAKVDELVSRLDSLLSDAVRLELQSDVPLGVFLSGGVDSSCIASYAADHTEPGQLRTFTIEFTEKGGDDPKFAALVSEQLKSRHKTIRVSPEEQFAAFEALLPMLDEPMSDTAIVATYLVSQAAREEGVKVLLSGAGGDELFGGYPRHHPGKIGSAAWFAALPLPIRVLISPAWRFYNPALSTRLANPARNFAVTISGANLAFLKSALRVPELFTQLLAAYERDFADAASENGTELMKLDLENYLPNNVLSLTDKATMAVSVEGRVPLLDHRIVEFAFSLPAETNLLDGEPKGLFKRVLQSRLPRAVLDRKKEGFNAPIHEWVRKWPVQIRNELLGNRVAEVDDLVDRKVLERWLSTDSLRLRCGDSLYALFVLNRWLRTHSPSVVAESASRSVRVA